jgi:hypothetical protein
MRKKDRRFKSETVIIVIQDIIQEPKMQDAPEQHFCYRLYAWFADIIEAYFYDGEREKIKIPVNGLKVIPIIFFEFPLREFSGYFC